MSRGLRLALAAAVLALAATARAAGPAPELALGAAKAPVTVIEYASLGCSHCAVWSRTVFPAFRKKYVDTGQVRFVLREMLTGDATLSAAGFMLAHCSGPARYYDVVEAVFDAQDEIERGGGPVLRRIALANGLTDAQYEACLSDQGALTALRARTARDAADNHITGTPTFLIGATRLEGERSLADLDAAIAQAERR